MTTRATSPVGAIEQYGRDHVYANEARYCHALRIPLGQSVVPHALAERLAPSRLWVEHVPGATGGALAGRRRACELARPIGADQGLRAVLINYADGESDLVLVAHRAVHSQASLRALADAVLDGPRQSSALADTGKVTTPPVRCSSPAWGLGDHQTGNEFAVQGLELSAGTDGSTQSWLAALAVVLLCYDREERPAVATLEYGERAGVNVWQALIDAETTLGAISFRTPDATVPIAVGVVFDDGGAGEYVPCLAPLFPLTITIGRNNVRCDHLLRAADPRIVTQFLRHLTRVHRLIVDSPWLPVAEVELLDAAEREHTIALGKSAAPESSTPRRVQDVFADRVAERPDAIALCCNDTRVSYGDLDEWSDRLARGLRALGVLDGGRVGICEERSAELVALLLAVLKAGAVYVPMDPAHPPHRLAYTIEDSELSVLVTSSTSIPVSDRTRVLTPAELAELGSQTGPIETAVTPDDPAYVIYTSGSTGRPKGVVVPHRNVISLLDATRADFQLGPDDVWSFFHSVAFDFSVWEIWGCLLTGGRLVVVPYWVSRSSEQFHDLMTSGGVTVLNQTPSAFGQLLEVDRRKPVDLVVRLVIFGGEPLDTRRLLPWFDRYPESRCRLVNMFGITETTVHVTSATIGRNAALVGSRSVGRALPGWSVHILDNEGHLVPPGVPGEIYVSGAGLALEYLRRPELTAERFVRDPFEDGRMYRSGDLGRLLPSGELEHLGRLDSQIKIRGHRIELGEIRSVIMESPGVVAAVVAMNNAEDTAMARLDAYVVLFFGSASQLRQRIARLLPDYMLPATITVLPELPLTANGKVDMANLPAPAPAAATVLGAGEPVADGNIDSLSAELLDVWRQVLRTPVGIDDDWFELGGNSLFAVRMAAAMRERGLPSPHPRTLYLNPTVRRLANVLRGESGHDT
ncbi:amino acid adenylation domain-containing protein [Nocardia colli]|uniref:amino acid adenylation domain-containing protein n=1 Tax=Nocardia colli TaxID=2545717 RepID=UPI0035D8D75E